MPSTVVNSVVQGHLGRIWFGTRNGIAVYDGVDWIYYTKEEGLQDNEVLSVKFDQLGNAWALQRKGSFLLSKLDGGKWKRLDTPTKIDDKKFSIRSFEVIATKASIQIVALTTNQGVIYYNGKNWINFSTANGLPSNSPNNVVAHASKFYIATDKGIVVIQNGELDYSLMKTVPAKYNEVLALEVEQTKKANRLWVLSTNGLGYIEENKYTLVSDQVSAIDHKNFGTFQFCSDYYGLAVYGNQYGVMLLNKETGQVTKLEEKSTINANVANAIYKDKEWNLWIVGRTGVMKLRSMRFQNFRERNGLLSDEVTAITQRVNGDIIFGHHRGLSILKNNGISVIPFHEKDNSFFEQSRVLDLHADKNNNIWIAAYKRGFGKMNSQNQIKWIKINPHETANSIIDINGVVYALTNNSLYKIDENDGLKKIILPENVVNKSGLRKLFVTPNGELCISTISQGVIILEKSNRFRTILSNSNLKANNVFSVLFNNDGECLLGTSAGLYEVLEDSVKIYNKNGLEISYPVYFLTTDFENNLWVGTDHGVIKWNGREQKEFSVRNGLVGMETNRDAGFVDKSGRVWIGTDRGVSKYLREFDYKPRVLPGILVEAIEPKMGLLEQNVQYEISPVSNQLVFRVKVISIYDENQNRYSYKLIGVDETWNTISIRNSLIRYTNLAPGKYELIIKGENAEGIWSDEYHIAKIIIPTPFYFTWWFFFLLISGFSFILYVFVTFRLNKRYSIKLQNEVTRRTELLNDSERRYRQMFENNQAIMLLMDADTTDIISVNNAAKRFYGYSEEQLINMRYTTLSNNVSAIDVNETIENSIDENQLLLSQHRLANGNHVFVEVGFSKLTIKDRILYYAIIHDVSERIITELALKESEEKYRSLIENMLDGVCVIQKGNLIFVNNTLAKFVGSTPKDIINKPFPQFVAPEDRDQVLQRYKDRMEGKNVENEYEFKLLHIDNVTRVYCLTHVSLISYSGSNAVLATLKNITESKLQESKIKQYYTIIEQMPVGVLITDVNSIIEYANPKFRKMTGYSGEELLGKNAASLKSELDHNDTKSIINTLLNGNVWSGEVQIRRKNGSNYWALTTISPVKDQEGEIYKFIIVEQDITFEKYAREEIKRNEKLLTSIINHAPIIIFGLDTYGNFTLSRGKDLNLLGLKNDQIVGMSVFDLYDNEPGLIDDIKRAITGEAFVSERKIGEHIFETSYNPITDEDNEVVGSIGVVYNITDRFYAAKQLLSAKEDAERSDRLKTDFLAQMSHEIRTPVNTILSFTSLLENEVSDKISDELREAFNYIDGGGRRLIRTIDMILNMSQLQTGTYKPILQKVDINNDVLVKIIAELKSSANRKNLKLNYIVETDSTLVEGDNYTIGQIFINLIDNAIKYTHSGKIEVRVFQNISHLVTEIKDTGIGISREFLPNLFDAFSQEETGYTRRFDGTGLGLALVKKYLEVNNAHIEVDSTKGEGTKFQIYFKSTKVN